MNIFIWLARNRHFLTLTKPAHLRADPFGSDEMVKLRPENHNVDKRGFSVSED
jgi:hypothetical protein